MVLKALTCGPYDLADSVVWSYWCWEKMWHDRDTGEPQWENRNAGLWAPEAGYAACRKYL